jgi:dephospho-CoA kinase
VSTASSPSSSDSSILNTTKLLVGLTGGIGSGKTWVANAFAERGASVIDADAISRTLTAAGGAAIAPIQAAFGSQMITPEGALDRTKMRELIFSDVHNKEKLEAILHPLIRAEVAQQTRLAAGPYIIYVVPLLVETGVRDRLQLARILVVDCDEALQVQRVMERDGLPEQTVKNIIAHQATRAERLAIATDVIHNQTTLEAIAPEIDRLHRLYCELARNLQKNG